MKKWLLFLLLMNFCSCAWSTDIVAYPIDNVDVIVSPFIETLWNYNGAAQDAAFQEMILEKPEFIYSTPKNYSYFIFH